MASNSNSTSKKEYRAKENLNRKLDNGGAIHEKVKKTLELELDQPSLSSKSHEVGHVI